MRKCVHIHVCYTNVCILGLPTLSSGHWSVNSCGSTGTRLYLNQLSMTSICLLSIVGSRFHDLPVKLFRTRVTLYNRYISFLRCLGVIKIFDCIRWRRRAPYIKRKAFASPFVNKEHVFGDAKAPITLLIDNIDICSWLYLRYYDHYRITDRPVG